MEIDSYLEAAHKSAYQFSIVYDLGRSAEKLTTPVDASKSEKFWLTPPYLHSLSDDEKHKIHCGRYVLVSSRESDMIYRNRVSTEKLQLPDGQIPLPSVHGSRVEVCLAKAMIIEQFELLKIFLSTTTHVPYNKKRLRRIKEEVYPIFFHLLDGIIDRRNEVVHEPSASLPTMKEATAYFYYCTRSAQVYQDGGEAFRT